MSAIDKYFNHFNDQLNESHKLDIIKMYNNIQTYDYYDIFDTDMTFNSIHLNNNKNKYTLLKPKNHHLIKTTVILSNKTKIYKIFIFQNDNNKDYFLINTLREFYFQTKFREHFINNNITNIIVPEIYRYGIINIEKNNEIICFAEMKYYDPSDSEMYKMIEQEQTYKKKVEKLYDYSKFYNDVIHVVIREAEEQLQIYHNDVLGIGVNMTQYHDDLHMYDETGLSREYSDINTKFIYANIFPSSNNNHILIDFERASLLKYKDVYNGHYSTRILKNLINDIDIN